MKKQIGGVRTNCEPGLPDSQRADGDLVPCKMRRRSLSRPINHPVCGTSTYGSRKNDIPDMHLHTATSFSSAGSQTASRIGLHH